MEHQSIPKVKIREKVKLDFVVPDSRLDNYQYPCRFDSVGFFFIVSGQIDIWIDLVKYQVGKGDIVIVLPRTIIHMKDYSDDFSGYFIVFSPEIIRNIDLYKKGFPYRDMISNNPVFTLDKGGAHLFSDYCRIFHETYLRLADIPDDEILEYMLMTLLYGVLTAYKRTVSARERNKYSRKEEIYRSLLRQIMEHYEKERSVSFYADKLCVTPKHLSAVVREVSGKSVSGLIADAVILDAKSQLKNSTNTIEQISGSLSFPDPSFFGKYFKRVVGMSPKQYRDNN
jgi:AraC family transcriptional activator of pobA